MKLRTLAVAICCLAIALGSAAAQDDLPEPELFIKPAATVGAGNSQYFTSLSATNDNEFSREYPEAFWGSWRSMMRWGVSDYLDLGWSAPLHFDKTEAENEVAQGDVNLFTKFIYPPYPHSGFFDLAFFGGLSLPTGSQTKGLFVRKFTNDKFAYSSGNIDFTLLVVGNLDLRKVGKGSPFSFRFNAGEEFTGSANQDDYYRAGFGISFYITPHFQWLTDLSGETKAISGISPAKDPLRFSTGVNYQYKAVQFLFSTDISLTDTDERRSQPKVAPTKIQPKYMLNFSIAYFRPGKRTRDPDKDRIVLGKDNCPESPEDFDGFEDSDGCPDFDNDNDGIPDLKERCPDRPEDFDGFEDSDGCPDIDNDADEVPDSLDKCQNEKEDMDGFEDEDGCPEIDNDKDGVADAKDACPNNAEDRDGYEDVDGCPDLDNDKDGIPDTLDKCPDKKETMNGYGDKDGCPDVKPKGIGIGRAILGGVRFVKGASVWTSDSKEELDRLVASLRAFPKTSIEIHGHTDSFGPRRDNQILSDKMARSVVNYLIKRGVSASRLAAKGFGETKPIASNKTAEGRDRNRRIEVYRKK